MRLEVTTVTVVDVPEGATHYCGDLTDCPDFYKCKLVAGFEHWFHYRRTNCTWMFSSHFKPHWIEEIQNTPTVKIIP